MDKSSQLFSCLIANYNNAKYLPDCFNSIIAQTYKNIEIVIVDDGSTDNSWEVIESFRFPASFKLIKHRILQNQGCGYAKRKCVELATGEICGFIDPDDTIESQAIQLMTDVHLNDGNVSLVSSKFNYVDENLQITTRGKIGEVIPDKSSYLCYGQNAITAFATFKLTKYQQSLGIDPRLKRAVDQDLYYKLEEIGNVKFINEYLYNYRITNQSISANENSFKADYWHIFIVMDSAYKRRKIGSSACNISKIYLSQKKQSHLIWRIKLSKESYWRKFNFVMRAIITCPFRNSFYLLKCLVIPNYA